MSAVRKRERSELVKLAIFAAVSAVLAGYLVVLTGDIHAGTRTTYKAQFANVSGLKVGNQVRVASVAVGKVSKIDVQQDASVTVTFDVDENVRIGGSTTATVRYRNLIGDRFLELDRAESNDRKLSVGATIPSSQTDAALDLDTLLNGFKPLFVGLNAEQVNQLSDQLVQVLQGQSGAVKSLLSTVASLTGTIGAREELVTQVIKNLDTVLGVVDGRKDDLGAIIDGLSSLVVGLEKQDTELLDAAGRITDFADDTSVLLSRSRADITGNLKSLAAAAKGLNSQADTLETVLKKLPEHYQAIGQTSSYGNFFNFFLCGVRVKLSDGSSPLQTPWINSDQARCKR